MRRRVDLGRAGLSLIEVLVGAMLAVIAAFVVLTALKYSSKATTTTMVRQETQLALRRLTNQLQRDFGRRQPNGNNLASSPQVFLSTSQCQDLVIRQTILPAGVRTIAYQTVCSGPEFVDATSRRNLSSDLSTQCVGYPVLRVTTTEPNGTSYQSQYPTRDGKTAAVLACFHKPHPTRELVEVELDFSELNGSNWKHVRKIAVLGLDSAGAGVEIIPPQ